LSSSIAKEKVKNAMDAPLPIVSEETLVDAIRPLLERHQDILVKRSKELVGMTTQSDLLKTIG
jgi:predicted transcriptional regulator